MFERDPELPTYMASDPNRIQQVTINLLNNAVKFTDTGIIHLKALYKPVEKVIRIEVHDTGIGISQQQQKKLFENFGGILAVTSANLSGESEENDPQKIAEKFPQLDLVIDGKISYQKPSTVAKIINNEITILRQGPIFL